MRKLTIVLLVLAASLVFGAGAYAQAGGGGGAMGPGSGMGPGGGMEAGGGMGPGKGGGPAGRMAELDKDGDGLISKDEWLGRAEGFDRIDANGDGKLDSVELAAARQKIGEWRRQRGEWGGRMERGGWRGRVRERMSDAAMFMGALFRMIDADRDGKLSDAEIQAFGDKIKGADADKDGYVTAEEARAAVREGFAKRAGKAFIEKHDANKDGQVTPDEFTNEERFKKLDTNGDGAITLDDFQSRARQGGAGMRPRGGEGEGPGEGGGMGMGRGGKMGHGGGTGGPPESEE